MDQIKILLWEVISENALNLLKAHFQVVLPHEIGLHQDISGIVTRGKSIVDQALLDQLPDVQVIVRCGVGVDNIDLDICRKKGIKVFNTPGLNAASVAEHTLMLILMLSRDAFNGITSTRVLNPSYRDHFPGNDVRDQKLGIIGYGHIGQTVAKLAVNFKMDVSYWNRQKKDMAHHAQYLQLNRLLATSDILSFHLPLTKKTRNWFDQQKLEQCKDGVILINTARGPIADEDILLKGLESGKISAFGGDLAEGYRSKHPLYSHPKCYVTPHVASLCKLTYREMCQRGIHLLIDYLKGQTIEKFYEVC